MESIDIQIIDKKLEIIVLNSEYEDWISLENKLVNILNYHKSYIKHLENKIQEMYTKRTCDFIKKNLTDEQINNVKIVLEDEHMKNT